MQISEKLPRESGRDYALRTLKANIISLELAPGSRISENELASELGLSRTPVREALIDLSKVNIVEIHPQKKSTVSLIDYDLVEESRFLRNAVEPEVVELVCAKASENDILKLKENLKLQSFYLENFNAERLLALDNAFHETLFEIAGKQQIYSLIQNISIHFDRVRSLALFSVNDLKIVEDHEKIVEAILSKDASTAREIMKLHLNRYKVDAAQIREKYPQYLRST
ncbi:MAG: GntR family transcriptional regulator [Lachnospiraceae bacterium]|nr:GntR family transcriptional regulator [Lachnospiraceae bacterium]